MNLSTCEEARPILRDYAATRTTNADNCSTPLGEATESYESETALGTRENGKVDHAGPQKDVRVSERASLRRTD